MEIRFDSRVAFAIIASTLCFYSSQIASTYDTLLLDDFPALTQKLFVSAYYAQLLATLLGATLFGAIANRSSAQLAAAASLTLMGLSVSALVLVSRSIEAGSLIMLAGWVLPALHAFAISGAFVSLMLYFFELAPTSRRGTFAGLFIASISAGSFVSYLWGFSNTNGRINIYLSWDLAFFIALLGAFFGLAMLCFQPRSSQPPEPSEQDRHSKIEASSVAICSLIILTIIMFARAETILSSSNVISVHRSGDTFILLLVTAISDIFAAIIGGVLCDKVGPKPVLVWSMIFAVIAIVTFTVWFGFGSSSNFIGLLAISSGLVAACACARTSSFSMARSKFPAPIRGTAIGLAYGLAASAAVYLTGIPGRQIVNGDLVLFGALAVAGIVAARNFRTVTEEVTEAVAHG